MGLDYRHPEYTDHLPDWQMMRDFYKGERAVKLKGTTYLPATPGMIADGYGQNTNTSNLGYTAYDGYKSRALFPDYVKEAVEAYIGLLHLKEPTISLPSQLEFLRDRATLHGESLSMLLRRINEEQLVSGRVGLLLDLPAQLTTTTAISGPVNPYIAFYAAETVVNWDDNHIGEGEANLNLVILDESGKKRDDNFNWILQGKYRVLMLFEGVDQDGQPIGKQEYRFGVFESPGGGTPVFVESDMKAAQWRGQVLDTVPFVFVNSKDITPETDEPPLMGLARLCRAIYCGEADLRQNLFMQGQDTLVLSGERKKAINEIEGATTIRTGAGSVIEMETGGTAEYVGVTATGLAEQRQNLIEDHQRAASRAGQLINMKANGVESGDALKTRVAAQTATLTTIALAGAAALEKILKMAARWIGANENEVKVDPNLEFADYDMSGDNLVKLMTAIEMGAPLSLESVHGLMAEQGVTRMDFKTEMELVKKQQEERRKIAEDQAAKAAELAAKTKVPGTPGSQTKPGGDDPASKKAGIVPQK